MCKNRLEIQSLSIKAIKDKLDAADGVPPEWEERLQQDTRQGVKKLLSQWQSRKKKALEQAELYKEMSKYERKLYENGIQYIAGIDEVGRGPLAGPVVAAAVILPEHSNLTGINDSKQISEKRRNEFYRRIQEQAVSIGVGVIDAPEIDRVNIYEATKLAMKQALFKLGTQPEHLLIDAMKLATGLPETSLIKGDSRSISIAAASIVAKVTRDRMMTDFHTSYPEYHFVKNMGYGTKEHLQAIDTFGPTPLHRMSFAPLNQFKG